MRENGKRPERGIEETGGRRKGFIFNLQGEIEREKGKRKGREEERKMVRRM